MAKRLRTLKEAGYVFVGYLGSNKELILLKDSVDPNIQEVWRETATFGTIGIDGKGYEHAKGYVLHQEGLPWLETPPLKEMQRSKTREVTIQTPNGKVLLTRTFYPTPACVIVLAQFNDDPTKHLFAGSTILTLQKVNGKSDISFNGFTIRQTDLKRGGDLLLSLPVVLGAAFALLEGQD